MKKKDWDFFSMNIRRNSCLEIKWGNGIIVNSCIWLNHYIITRWEIREGAEKKTEMEKKEMQAWKWRGKNGEKMTVYFM